MKPHQGKCTQAKKYLLNTCSKHWSGRCKEFTLPQQGPGDFCIEDHYQKGAEDARIRWLHVLQDLSS